MLTITAFEWWITYLRIRDLLNLPSQISDRKLPSVCICIPARNEAPEVGAAMDSWLAQDYPGIRIVAVDDGSTDGTSELLQTRALAHPDRLRLVRNETLPLGWLGKNHALHLAIQAPEARQAEWLLFTDADMKAAPDLLRRAFEFLEEHPGDLLSLWPSMEAHTFWERLLVPHAILAILWGIPPKRVVDPKSRISFGAGAFILVRRSAYDATGGHAAAPLEPIDDIMLASRIKKAGYQNRMAISGPSLWLRPVRGLRDAVRSLRKNILGLPGLWPFAPVLAPLSLVLFLAPIWLTLGGHAWAGCLVWLLIPPMMGVLYQRVTERPMDPVWAFWPLMGILTAGVILLAFWDRLRGINRWRGREVRLDMPTT